MDMNFIEQLIFKATERHLNNYAEQRKERIHTILNEAKKAAGYETINNELIATFLSNFGCQMIQEAMLPKEQRNSIKMTMMMITDAYYLGTIIGSLREQEIQSKLNEEIKITE